MIGVRRGHPAWNERQRRFFSWNVPCGVYAVTRLRAAVLQKTGMARADLDTWRLMQAMPVALSVSLSLFSRTLRAVPQEVWRMDSAASLAQTHKYGEAARPGHQPADASGALRLKKRRVVRKERIVIDQAVH